jgi:hypothetical protein
MSVLVPYLPWARLHQTLAWPAGAQSSPRDSSQNGQPDLWILLL